MPKPLKVGGNSPSTSRLISSEDTACEYLSERSPLDIYLRDISRYRLLTRVEERRLAKRVMQGDAGAKERLIRSNLRLVVKIAHDYSALGLPLLDLISEGNIGLIKAVERFDPDKGGKLSTYAAWWIKQTIKRALANQGKTIRLPIHLIEKISRIYKAEIQLRGKLKRDPTNEEIALQTDLPATKVAHLKSVSVKPASLDLKIGTEQHTELGEIIQDENSPIPSVELLEKAELNDLGDILSTLEEREARVIELRFGLDGNRPRTLEEVGVVLSLTRERVRQLQMLALRNIRNHYENKHRIRTPKEIEEETQARLLAEELLSFVNASHPEES